MENRISIYIFFILFTLLLFDTNYGQSAGRGIIINETRAEKDVRFFVTISTLPEEADSIYLMGTFNNWDPGKDEPPDSTDILLNYYRGNTWTITLTLPSRARYEYKYTRGSYETREVAFDSSEVPNRIIYVTAEEIPVTNDTVQTWADFVQPPVPETGPPVLSYNNNSPQTSISVTWASESFGESRIYYGEEDINENMLSVNEHRDMIDKGDSLIHTITLTDLAPGTNYKYKVVTEGVFESEILSFTTAQYTDNFSIAIMGDNRPSADLGVQNSILGDDPGLILHVGDVVSKGKVLYTWFEFFSNWARPLGTIPWLIVYGNHEQDAYLNRFFNFPENGSSDPDNFGHWYSMNYNNVHIIVLDNYRDYSAGSEQYNWLINDLENISDEIDHTLVLFHEPPFSSGKHGPNLTVREILVPVMEQYQVDMVFCGHEHLYERSIVNGIPYITTGGAGSPLYNIHGGANEYSVYAEVDNHYLKLNVDGKNLSLEVVRTDSVMIDYFEILKEPPPPVPENYKLFQNYPNPFNPVTTIRYSVPGQSYVKLQVYDALGALVATLVDEQKSPGTYEVEFNINAASNNVISSGVYLYRLLTNDYQESNKFIILK